MGVGGVLALGCTIGQVSGIYTCGWLYSSLTFIIFGSAITMKFSFTKWYTGIVHILQLCLVCVI